MQAVRWLVDRWSDDILKVLRRGSEDIPLNLAVMRLGSLLLTSSKLTLASASMRDAFMDECALHLWVYVDPSAGLRRGR